MGKYVQLGKISNGKYFGILKEYADRHRNRKCK